MTTTLIDRIRNAALPDDSIEPGWSVNAGRPLWLGPVTRQSDEGFRDVMRLGGSPDDKGGAGILIATVDATLTREQVNKQLDDGDWDSLIRLSRNDLSGLAVFLQLAVKAGRK
jgi:hypothetical protein